MDARPAPPVAPPRPAARPGVIGFHADPTQHQGLFVDKVGKSFRRRPVVKSVSLRLSRGEVVGLLGPNGAGKTTCFYMITGLISPDYGSIFLDGEDVTGQPMYQRARLGVGYLPQEASIFRGMTVEQNVMAVVEMREKNRARAQETVTRLLEELRIEHLRKSPAVSLSGGERRRCEIARALASEPSFMLLDEPFAGIDPLAITDIREVIRYLKGRGIGILITDHNVRETLGITDRASIIHSGEVLFEGAPDEVLHDPEVRRVYLGDQFS
ncbi:MAG: LPS export ABC transporter ATP-binding protein [Proteobacteria bacterium]|nr:LPS export ABC transporter ATP-binding protein [Pseudomonadota bacterium]MBW3618137.1 LPS export ABC transporter ATP-binding protein [Pseudomonadota bacterium]